MTDIHRRLFGAFGPQHWWPGDTQLEIAVGAILTQNTAWSNVEKAIAVLKSHRLLTLERLTPLSPTEIAPLIRSAGFYNIKAARLAAFLGWLKSTGGFAGLRRIPTAELRAQLLACHGIGPETADSILLYALSRPVFVVDTYTRRILSRYGLIVGDEHYDTLRAMFESTLPRSTRLYNEYHALLVRLAKTNCRSQPSCDSCPLA
ncbi:endonuclease III domain-containing protein [candidate division WOR-3 bacterium]|nr:endonuclease III domain-containing protein [candidate division WOR-3 bacterium]